MAERWRWAGAVILAGAVLAVPFVLLSRNDASPSGRLVAGDEAANGRGASTTTPGRPGTTGAAGPGTAGSATTAGAGAGAGPRRGSGQPVTLAFGGDVHFEGQLANRLAADPDIALAALEPMMADADLAMVNLETAITTRGTAAPGKAYTFRAPATALQALKAAGVDVASMANNHGLDYGPAGLSDSLTAIKQSGFPVLGIGANVADALAPYRTTIKGQRISIIAATQVLDANLVTAWTATENHGGLAAAADTQHLVAAVQQARATSDTVVVYLHWGTELQTCPNSAQGPLAERLTAAGADVVVGSHAHRLLAGGHLGSAYVDYGLGNFAFYTDSGPTTESGVLTLTVTGRDVDHATFTPAQLQGQVARALTGAAAAQAVRRWEGLRSCAGLAP